MWTHRRHFIVRYSYDAYISNNFEIIDSFPSEPDEKIFYVGIMVDSSYVNDIIFTDLKEMSGKCVKIIIIIVYSAKSCSQMLKISIICHTFFLVSASHKIHYFVLPLLLWTISFLPTIRCPLIDLLWPTNIIYSIQLTIPF